MKIIALILLMGLLGIAVAITPQYPDMPVIEYACSSQSAPLILYISGDGGFNKFSLGVCSRLNKAGNHIIAINAQSYFWNKKDPAEAAMFMEQLIEKSRLGSVAPSQIDICGYSFGADIIPFVVNKMKDSVRYKIAGIVMLSPSRSTDFQIHLLDFLYNTGNEPDNILSAIKAMRTPRVTIIENAGEISFSTEEARTAGCFCKVLSGDHHYDFNLDTLSYEIISDFNGK